MTFFYLTERPRYATGWLEKDERDWLAGRISAGLRPIRQGRLVAGHHATVIGTDVEPADVVGHFTVPCKEALFQT
jgi:hypothetical protein